MLRHCALAGGRARSVRDRQEAHLRHPGAMTPPSHSRYRIKTVARLTGIAPATIRAWERRHALLEPLRTEGGQRLYTDADVALLHRVKAMLDTGLGIGEVVEALAAEQFQGEVPTRPPLEQEGPSSGDDPFEPVCEALMGAFLRLDRDAAERVLRPLLPLYSFEVTFERILTPTLLRLGAQWRQGRGSVAAEHFGAGFVREKLIAMLSAVSAPGAERPRALLACLEGERHELGLLYLALRLSARGWATVYLGADMPLEGLLEAQREVRPGILALSLTRLQERERVLEAVGRLCREAWSGTVIVGGVAVVHWREGLEEAGARVIIDDGDLNAAVRAAREANALESGR